MKKKEYIYSNYTYNSKNPIARFAHRSRFSIASQIIMSHQFNSILDYGAGDCRFLSNLTINANTKYFAYEPIMKVKPESHIQLLTNEKSLNNHKYDAITCFEVLEHFNIKEQEAMLQTFLDILSTDGIIIISVPIETGFPSLVKNIRRMSIGDDNEHLLLNTIKCFLGLSIPERQNRSGYYPSHIGFNHRNLEKLFSQNFIVEKKQYSPFKQLPVFLNSQIFYTLKKYEANIRG